jgi:hypothetical protein
MGGNQVTGFSNSSTADEAGRRSAVADEEAIRLH